MKTGNRNVVEGVRVENEHQERRERVRRSERFTYEEEWAIIVERKGWWDGTDRNKHRRAEEGSQG